MVHRAWLVKLIQKVSRGVTIRSQRDSKCWTSLSSFENRSATFDASSYLSANADLQAAFGSDLEAAKKHYINHGSSENRLLA